MKAAKRRQIMKAAETLFSGGRFHEVTMEEVAREAGVGKGTIYRYFRDKDELFSEVALAGYDEMCEMVRTERERSADFRECLVNVCRRVSAFHRRRRKLGHVMQAEERRVLCRRGPSRELWLSKRRELIAAVTDLLEQGRRAGDIRDDISLKPLAVFLLGMLRASGRERRVDRGFRTDHDVVVDLFLHGAAPGKRGTAGR